MTPDEVQFCAEDDIRLRIIPNFTESVIYLLGSDLGPFEAGLPVTVPVWVAFYLKEKKKCRLEQPTWFTVEQLENAVKAECDSRVFTKLECEEYWVIGQMLLSKAPDDLTSPNDLDVLLKDLHDKRMAKLWSSVNMFLTDSTSHHAKLTNLSSMELELVRPILLGCLEKLSTLQDLAAEANAQQFSNTMYSNSFSLNSSNPGL